MKKQVFVVCVQWPDGACTHSAVFAETAQQAELCYRSELTETGKAEFDLATVTTVVPGMAVNLPTPCRV